MRQYTAHSLTYPVASTSSDTSLPVTVTDDTTLLFGLPNIDFAAISEAELETAIQAYAVEAAEAQLDADFEREIDEQATAAANARLEAEATAYADAQVEAEAIDFANAQIDAEALAFANAQIEAEAVTFAEAQIEAEAAEAVEIALGIALEDDRQACEQDEQVKEASASVSTDTIRNLMSEAVSVKEPRHIQALKRIRDRSRTVPHNPLVDCHDRFLAVSAEACAKFEAQELDLAITSRYLTCYIALSWVLMNWRPLTDYPGPIMHPLNRAPTVNIAHMLGIDGKTMSVVDLSYRNYDPSWTGKSPMQELEPEEMQSFIIAYLRHEAKVHLLLRNCCIHLLGTDVLHYWMKAISDEPIPHIDKVEPLVRNIYGQLYDDLRDRKIVKSGYSIKIPVAGFKYPEARSFDMLRLDNQDPEDSSIVCPGNSLIYLNLGGEKAALDIFLSTAVFHAANGTKMPDVKHLLRGGQVDRALDYIMRINKWAAAPPKSTEDLFSENPGAATFMYRNLACSGLQKSVEAQTGLKRDYNGHWLTQILEAAEKHAWYLPKLLQQCWLLKSADTRQRRKEGLLTPAELRVLDERNARARQLYKDNREKILAWQRPFYTDNHEKILAHKRRYKQDNREKILAYQRQYYKDNRERILAHKSQYYKDNREKILASQRQYHKDNREKILAHKRQYYKDNREKILASRSQYYKDNRERLRQYHAVHGASYRESVRLAMNERKLQLYYARKEGRTLEPLQPGDLIKRQAELLLLEPARQAELAAERKAKAERKAEAERLKAVRQAELEAERQAEAERKAEAKRIKAIRQAELAAERKAKAERKAEAERLKAKYQAELEVERQAEAERKAEAERVQAIRQAELEAERQAKAQRKAERERQSAVRQAEQEAARQQAAALYKTQQAAAWEADRQNLLKYADYLRQWEAACQLQLEREGKGVQAAVDLARRVAARQQAVLKQLQVIRQHQAAAGCVSVAAGVTNAKRKAEEDNSATAAKRSKPASKLVEVQARMGLFDEASPQSWSPLLKDGTPTLDFEDGDETDEEDWQT